MPSLSTLESLVVEIRDQVATVTLNRPEQGNSFDSVMVEELAWLWPELQGDAAVNVVLLTAAGAEAFCTGVHRSAVQTTDNFAFSALTYHDPGEDIGPKSRGLWKPVIAAVNGMACGGAFYLLGEADFIIAVEHATFFDPHLTYGMPAVFEPVLMRTRMPYGEIARLTLLGNNERMTAGRALEIGLVSEVTPAGELEERSWWAAEAIASQPTLPVQATVRALWESRSVPPVQATRLGAYLLGGGLDPELLTRGQAAFKSGRRIQPRLR